MSKQEKYKSAGVDQYAADALFRRLKDKIGETRTPGALPFLLGFAGLFRLQDYKKPVLVSGTDGVGTKLKLAFASSIHDTIGIDLVAMCVNDCLCVGAKPLFFLDYFATSNLDDATVEKVIEGIVEGCKLADCALLGGETAQLPGFYRDKEYDLAGFCVGAVEEDEIITGENIQKGDVVLALASSGLHSNGFSLVRKILFDDLKLGIDVTLPEIGKPLIQELLTPTRIYVKSVLAALKQFSAEKIRGIAHITGGGITENLPRILPAKLAANLDLSVFERPAIFKLLKEKGEISEDEMRRVFNCGAGLLLVVEKNSASEIKTFLEQNGETVYNLGDIVLRAADAIVYSDMR